MQIKSTIKKYITLKIRRETGPLFYKAYTEINKSSKKIIIFKIIEFICLSLLILIFFSFIKTRF